MVDTLGARAERLHRESIVIDACSFFCHGFGEIIAVCRASGFGPDKVLCPILSRLPSSGGRALSRPGMHLFSKRP